MHCIGGHSSFRVVARPDPSVDRPQALDELRLAAAEYGVERIDVSTLRPTEVTFEIEAGSPEAACEMVTVILRSVYGLNWDADVSPLRAGVRSAVAVWN